MLISRDKMFLRYKGSLLLNPSNNNNNDITVTIICSNEQQNRDYCIGIRSVVIGFKYC